LLGQNCSAVNQVTRQEQLVMAGAPADPPPGAPGKASLNLLKVLREGLLVAVRGAVHKAMREEAPVREQGLRVRSNGGIATYTRS
jgi:hypothetical protein